MRRNRIIIVFAVALLLPTFTMAKGVAISGRFLNTQGLGGELIGSITDRFNARLGYNYLSFSYTQETEEVSLDSDLLLSSINIFVDYFIVADLHLSGGAVINNNSSSSFGIPSQSFSYGGFDFTPEEIGAMTVDITYDKLAPYIGIGYGNPVGEGKVRFVFDLGVFYQNSPSIALDATNMLEPTEKNAYIIENNLKDLKFMPVLSMGITFRVFNY
ncbi:MAG: hypothetical protein P9L92_02755 [Candidatus Electryonea clarkiae]|nr:hypothetical protein [Candidatus Electryonea clarkiae]MDP8285809.1 hypothetical protein [Candidatus Electryonea clarkiae]